MKVIRRIKIYYKGRIYIDIEDSCLLIRNLRWPSAVIVKGNPDVCHIGIQL